MSLPFVTCICPTYNRAPDHLWLLEEAVESFLRQDYPASRRELIVYNDCPEQTLTIDPYHESLGVRIINAKERCPTLGDKHNEMVWQSAHEDLICPWDDDDISLPSRISQAVEMLGHADYWKPPQVWFGQRGQPLVWKHNVGVRHHASIFRHLAWERVQGYPPLNGSQDMALDQLLREQCWVAPEGNIGPRDWQYIYRWGVSPVHISSNRDLDGMYARIGSRPVVEGTFAIVPSWKEDYPALIRLQYKKGD